jgi:hypothetical protein
MVLIKQLMRGNSYRDIRKINPFANGRNSLFVQAVRNGNVELANLILDKSLKPNPIQPLLCTDLYTTRYKNLDIASNIAARITIRTAINSPMDRLRFRLGRILMKQLIFKELLLIPLVSSGICAAVIYSIAKFT